MTKICGLLFAVTLGIAFTGGAPTWAEAAGPEAPVARKIWLRRACDASLTVVHKAGDKLVKLNTRAGFALARSMLLPDGYLYRLDAWQQRQFEKLPEPVQRLFVPTPEDMRRTRIIEEKIQRAVLWPSQMAILATYRIPELFKSRASRIAHNTFTLMHASFPDASGAEQSDDALAAMERLIDEKLQGKFTYPLLRDALLFVKGKRLLKRFEAGTQITIENGLVVDAPKASLPPEYGVISPAIDHFLVSLLVAGYYPITDHYSYAYYLTDPNFERDLIEFHKRPAGLFEIALELLTSTPRTRQKFNVRELAKNAILASGEDYHARTQLEAKMKAYEEAAAKANYEASHSVLLDGPIRLFVEGKRLPQKFEAGTKVTLKNWFVVDRRN